FSDDYSGSFSRIVLYGLTGDDHIRVQDNVALPAWLFGDEGDDDLEGGGGPSILVGGDGDDQLHAARADSLLIGGRGEDRLEARGGAILIGGFTDHDANEAALDAILDEWRSARSYRTRVANLASLLNSSTAHDDGDTDRLSGDRERDWFLATLSGSKQ